MNVLFLDLFVEDNLQRGHTEQTASTTERINFTRKYTASLCFVDSQSHSRFGHLFSRSTL